MPIHPVDARIIAVATKQHRLFTRAQAFEAGADKSLIRRRLASGRWLLPAPLVYELPGEPRSFERSLWLAFLSAPDGAVVSHWSAANLHRLEGFSPTRFDLTVPHATTNSNPVALLHQTSDPPRIVRVRGLPVTTIQRTLVDLAKVAGPIRIDRALQAAILDNQITLERVRREFLSLARQGRNGITVMRSILDAVDGAVPPRTELEKHLDDVLHPIGVPFEHEAPLPGREVFAERADRVAHWPTKLIIEGDSRKWHARVEGFARDRQRDRRALAAGYPTARYCYWELVNDKKTVRAEVCELLGL
jgi:predicted transcriptional regulator of viral defense system